MMKFALLLATFGSIAHAAEIRYTWLPFSNSVPGAAQTQSDVTRYGINIFLHSDNAAVAEFQVSAVVKLSSGEVKVVSGQASREGKADGVQYSSICSLWVDTAPSFEVLAIEIKAVSSTAATRPIAGRAYASAEAQNQP